MTPEIICLEYVDTDFELTSKPSPMYAPEYKGFLKTAQRISDKPLKFINIHSFSEVICAVFMAH
jgi:hypothetical protein